MAELPGPVPALDARGEIIPELVLTASDFAAPESIVADAVVDDLPNLVEDLLTPAQAAMHAAEPAPEPSLIRSSSCPWSRTPTSWNSARSRRPTTRTRSRTSPSSCRSSRTSPPMSHRGRRSRPINPSKRGMPRRPTLSPRWKRPPPSRLRHRSLRPWCACAGRRARAADSRRAATGRHYRAARGRPRRAVAAPLARQGQGQQVHEDRRRARENAARN